MSKSEWGAPHSAQRTLIVTAIVAQLRANGVRPTAEHVQRMLGDPTGFILKTVCGLIKSWEL